MSKDVLLCRIILRTCMIKWVASQIKTALRWMNNPSQNEMRGWKHFESQPIGHREEWSALKWIMGSIKPITIISFSCQMSIKENEYQLVIIKFKLEHCLELSTTSFSLNPASTPPPHSLRPRSHIHLFCPKVRRFSCFSFFRLWCANPLEKFRNQALKSGVSWGFQIDRSKDWVSWRGCPGN